jgi:DNA-directed RNA polymerase subunit L
MVVSVELKKLTDREIRFVIYDEDRHSLPNLVTKLALKKPGVVYSAYILEHPMISYPEVVILTDGSRNPLEVLEEVVDEARKLVEDFLVKFEEALNNASKKGK